MEPVTHVTAVNVGLLAIVYVLHLAGPMIYAHERLHQLAVQVCGKDATIELHYTTHGPFRVYRSGVCKVDLPDDESMTLREVVVVALAPLLLTIPPLTALTVLTVQDAPLSVFCASAALLVFSSGPSPGDWATVAIVMWCGADSLDDGEGAGEEPAVNAD